MAKKESHRIETMVGIFVLLGLVVVSTLLFVIAGRQKLFEPRYRLTALFSQVGGLKVGSPVRLAGLEVGSVESLNFTSRGKVLASLSIQERYQRQIRKDSVASISSVGILGDKSVEITVGSKAENVLSSGAHIQAKDPFDVASIVDRLGPMSVNIEEILSYFSKITGEFAMEDLHLAETIQHANQILKKVDDGKGAIGAAVNDPTLYKELVSLARAGRETAEKLKATLSRIESASVDFPDLITSTRKAMEDVSAISRDFRSSTERFPEITEHVDQAAENIKIASEDLPAIAGSFRKTARDAEDVMEAARRSWLIKGNLPESSTQEERILLDGPPYLNEEVLP
jgi:phospholipid/cholesterol/gamma-HCH transport system substrate-binding protein